MGDGAQGTRGTGVPKTHGPRAAPLWAPFPGGDGGRKKGRRELSPLSWSLSHLPRHGGEGAMVRARGLRDPNSPLQDMSCPGPPFLGSRRRGGKPVRRN